MLLIILTISVKWSEYIRISDNPNIRTSTLLATMLMLLIADVKPSSKASTKNQQQWHITYLHMVMPVMDFLRIMK